MIPPVIVALDEYSNPKPGVEVAFEVAGGIGTVTSASVTTDSTGPGHRRRMDAGRGSLGTDTLIARVQNLPRVYFTARVSPPFIVSSVVSGYQPTHARYRMEACTAGRQRPPGPGDSV